MEQDSDENPKTELETLMIIAFDLDGTLSDPIVGIAGSLNYALDKLGFPTRPQPQLEKFVGPPLPEIFAELLGGEHHHLVSDAIFYFRERYFDIGYKENTLYPGIIDMLDELKNGGHSLYVATSKKHTIANAVTDFFGITNYFKAVLGSGISKKKYELLNEIKTMENSKQMVMVGDRLHDMEAGKTSGYFCIGISWGYGTKSELLDSGADVICENPANMRKFLPG